MKFADDTTVVGLITHSDKSAYRQEVEGLETWCKSNNLSINVNKTKMVVDGKSSSSSPHRRSSCRDSHQIQIPGGALRQPHLEHQHSQHSGEAHQHLYLLRRLDLALQSSLPFTGVWWRASSHPASLCGIATAQLPVDKHSSGW